MKTSLLKHLFICLFMGSFFACSEEEVPEPEVIITEFAISTPFYAKGDINQESGEITILIPHNADISRVTATATHPEGTTLSLNLDLALTLEGPQRSIAVSSETNRKRYWIVLESGAPQLPLFIRQWFRLFGDSGIGAAFTRTTSLDDGFLFNASGTQYYQLYTNSLRSGPHPVGSGVSGFFYNCPFDSIGTAEYLYSGSKWKYFVFNQDGTRWASYRSGEGWSRIHALAEWGPDNTHPFRLAGWNTPAGVGAILREGFDNIHFDRSGSRYVHYNTNTGEFGPVMGLGSRNRDNFLGNFPFTAVGAALTVKTDLSQIYPGENSTHNSYVHVLFNPEGTRLVFYHHTLGFSAVCRIV